MQLFVKKREIWIPMISGVEDLEDACGGQEKRELDRPREELYTKLRKEIKNCPEKPKSGKSIAGTEHRSTVKDAAREVPSEQTEIIPASSSTYS